MPYTEYFDVGTHTNEYSDYLNQGANYTNYLNLGTSYYNASYVDHCSAGHYNTATRDSTYKNYTNYDNYNNAVYDDYADVCTESHYDYLNVCTQGYDNHWNYTSTDKGQPIELSWSSPWGGTEELALGATYIAESVDAIKQLRDNMKEIEEKRLHRGTQTPITDLAPDSPNIGDSELNDENPLTAEKVEDDQFDALRDSLNNLWLSIKKSGDSGIPDKDVGDIVKKENVEGLAKGAINLGEEYTDPTYVNHFDTTYDHQTFIPS